MQDAERFARLFAADSVSPAALKTGYLDGAGRGVAIFTPHRIQNAENLARAVAANNADYAHAITTCLPLVRETDAELRAIYLAFRGLLPERPLPQVHIVFGAGNSGGTAAPDAQVLGLEVLCRVGTTPDQFRQTMRRFFAHETVHTWQTDAASDERDTLLRAALSEGVADFLASLVTGLSPDESRERYALAREADIWTRFEADRMLITASTGATDAEKKLAAKRAFGRWFANAGQTVADVPAGWPGELGYWVGMRIAAAYFERATDKRVALNTLIEARDPQAILRESGYRPRHKN
ncbi:MAG: hypothetical protein JNN20_15095 [Betaproteobacteria bacterium]|nr:hypothetical protein [Betaproteobacteria bacterium]